MKRFMHLIALTLLALSAFPGGAYAQVQGWFEQGQTPEGLPFELLRSVTSQGTVILAHGCGGPFAVRDRGWATALANAGFNTVAFDSWAWRGIPGGVCRDNRVSGEERTKEVELMVAHLKSQAWHSGPIHLLGWSHGGTLALQVSRLGLGITKAVAMYPWCEPQFANPKIPVQIHIGGADDWTPAYRCAGLYSSFFGKSQGTLFEYPGAYHDFDMFMDRDFTTQGRGERGIVTSRRLKTDAQARDLAVQRVVAFFGGKPH
jgi:dienelactone hydrolase